METDNVVYLPWCKPPVVHNCDLLMIVHAVIDEYATTHAQMIVTNCGDHWEVSVFE